MAEESAETALRESEALFRTLAETVPAAIYIYREDRYCYVNSAAEAITGYTRNELLTMDLLVPVHPDDRHRIGQYVAARQQGDPAPTRYELMLLTKSGEERWCDVIVAKIGYQ